MLTLSGRLGISGFNPLKSGLYCNPIESGSFVSKYKVSIPLNRVYIVICDFKIYVRSKDVSIPLNRVYIVIHADEIVAISLLMFQSP